MRKTMQSTTTQVVLPETRKTSNGHENSRILNISAPNIRTAVFKIIGDAPLVIHRFSQKGKQTMLHKMIAGSTAKKGKKREPFNPQEAFEQAKYVSKEGWEGFNVASIRCALISACRLVGFKMTLAKLSLFVDAEGRDRLEPQYGLIRINGKSRLQEDIGRVETWQAYVIVRPSYDEWNATLRIRFDADQFELQDVANLLSRAGAQVGIGEGRPDSKNSCGMGWGVFHVEAAS